MHYLSLILSYFPFPYIEVSVQFIGVWKGLFLKYLPQMGHSMIYSLN